jgi:kumamolisin
MQKFRLPGSERSDLAGANRIGDADPKETVQVLLILRRADPAAMREHLARLAKGEVLPAISRQAFGKSHGAAAADIEAVKRFAAEHHLQVRQADLVRRQVKLEGSVAECEAAFGVKLCKYQHPNGEFRGREGAVMLPEALRGVVQAVLGLDNRPQARPHFRRAGSGEAQRGIRPAAAGAISYTPIQLAGLYQFPAGSGAGETIGFIELGGGTTTSDFEAYFASLGLTPPKLVSVPVDSGSNDPTGSPDGPDGEVMLDVEVAGAIAPHATLAVYFAPNTDAGFLDAITSAIHDTTNKPSIISISWGGPESSWTQQSFTAFDQAFQDAASLGITVCVAAGDNGSSDGTAGNQADFPASSPHVLACGGTSLKQRNHAIASETVWNDGAQGGATGGGISGFFGVPAWQSGLSAPLTAGGTAVLTGRGLPDVAGDADPATGYQIRVDGSDTVVGGTSAVAPLWSGLIARLNAARGRPLGFINAQLYQNASACRDITQGNNGTYKAGKGWDACTGIGSPNGAALARLFGSQGGVA